MAVIRETHAEEYLMAVAYCTNRLREEGHLVGPGKGILARSLVAYALGISEIDPIEYDLPFTDFQDSVFPTAVWKRNGDCPGGYCNIYVTDMGMVMQLL